MFPRLYSDQSCPIDGYAGYSFRVLLNPTGQEKTDWALGHPGIEGCLDCAALRKKSKAVNPYRVYCLSCQTARDQLGRSACAIYGTSHVEGFDFATPESALATFGMDDLPDELLYWLYRLPAALWLARTEEIKKKLPSFLETGDSTTNSA